jgi:leader peptidase (prepilin peptidase)/N-methyltransferase
MGGQMVENKLLIFLIYFVMLLILIFIAFVDAKLRRIHMRSLYILAIGSTFAVYAKEELTMLDSYSAMAVMFIVLCVIYQASQKSIGWGDVILCSCIAPYFGLEKSLSMLAVALMLCGLAAILLLCTKRSRRKDELPFAPFIVLSTFIVMFF